MAFVRESLAATEAREYTQAMAKRHREQAFAGLQRIGLQNQAQTDLETIARFLVDRTY
jgi:geranylgeranyl pyrophosphate synthase